MRFMEFITLIFYIVKDFTDAEKNKNEYDDLIFYDDIIQRIHIFEHGIIIEKKKKKSKRSPILGRKIYFVEFENENQYQEAKGNNHLNYKIFENTYIRNANKKSMFDALVSSLEWLYIDEKMHKLELKDIEIVSKQGIQMDLNIDMQSSTNENGVDSNYFKSNENSCDSKVNQISELFMVPVVKIEIRPDEDYFDDNLYMENFTMCGFEDRRKTFSCSIRIDPGTDPPKLPYLREYNIK